MAETHVVLQCPSFEGCKDSCKGCTFSTYAVIICIFLSIGLMGSTIDVLTSHSATYHPDTGDRLPSPDPARFLALFILGSFAVVTFGYGTIQAACRERCADRSAEPDWDEDLPNTCSRGRCGPCYCSRALVATALALIVGSLALSVVILIMALNSPFDNLTPCNITSSNDCFEVNGSPCPYSCTWDYETQTCSPSSSFNCYSLHNSMDIGFAFIGPGVLFFVLFAWVGLSSCCLREVKLAGSDGETFEFEESAEHHQEEEHEMK